MSYVVVDLPEAIFSNLGLTFLAHTHIPTIWDARNIWLEKRRLGAPTGRQLQRQQRLPNQITIGAKVRPSVGLVEMELWVRNDSSQKLTGLRTQIWSCSPVPRNSAGRITTRNFSAARFSAASSATGDRWLLTAWDRCGRAWGNPPVPCLHSDPVLPDCSPEPEVRVRGPTVVLRRRQIDTELERVQKRFDVLPKE